MQFGRKSIILGFEDKFHFETNISKSLKVQTLLPPPSPLFFVRAPSPNNHRNTFFNISVVLSVLMCWSKGICYFTLY